MEREYIGRYRCIASLTDRYVYAASENKASHVFCFDRENAGREVWRFSENTFGFGRLAVAGNDLFIGGRDDSMRWIVIPEDSGGPSRPVQLSEFSRGGDDAVIFGSYDHYLYSIDRNSGKLWTN